MSRSDLARFKRRVPVMKQATLPGVLFLVMLILFCAQARAQTTDGGEGLKLRLVIPNPEICVDSKSLALEVVIANDTSQPIAIYKSSLSEFAFTSESRNHSTSTFLAFEDDKDVVAGAAKESPITIEPHSSVVIPLSYDVSGKFFYGADVYSLRVGYRDIVKRAASNAFNGHEKSNAALFRRIPCE
jgi:hypothetical protein